MTFDEIRQIALSYPGVTEHVVFDGPTFKVGKRFLASIAKIDPNSLCIKVPNRLDREYFLAQQPEIYYLTDHYANFECLLVRIPMVDPGELRELFEGAWRTYAPTRLVAAYGQVRCLSQGRPVEEQAVSFSSYGGEVQTMTPSSSGVPAGYHTTTTYLIVPDADHAEAFYRQAFDAEVLRRSIDPAGVVRNIQIRIGDSPIMLGIRSSDAPVQDGRVGDLPRVSIFLFVDDPDDIFDRAVAAGATALYRPEDQDYGLREGGIVDPFGVTWWIGRVLPSWNG